ncbi:WAT1-related protein [Cucumis melo var. makuwa]|uniref:WAT1-related protein n=1 Tax=Cucumis melo var. makuwa TaxID=1194695 RepID=A0A5D3C3B1_CUCMM|nr:WAT1-related protein [Cucumis melo var. makuwa]
MEDFSLDLLRQVPLFEEMEETMLVPVIKRTKTTHDLVHPCKDPIARHCGKRQTKTKDDENKNQAKLSRIDIYKYGKSTHEQNELLYCDWSVVITNTYFTGLKYVTPTFSTAMSNCIPALSFFFAWVFRMEKVDVRRFSSQAKILGTAVTVGGAMIMTFVEGPKLRFPWTHEHSTLYNHPSTPSSNVNNKDSFKGVILIIIAILGASVACIIQAIVLKSYPLGLVVTFMVCIVGVVEGTVVALAKEWNNPPVWSIHFDFQLLSFLYAGIAMSGFAYFIQGVVLETKGPVFLTIFFPLSTIIVAVISSFAVSEVLSLGKIVGALVIIMGLYLVLWGKTKDHAIENKAARPIDDATPIA